MSRKRDLKAGSSAPRNFERGHGGTHHKSIPESAIKRLAKAGATPRMIAKKLGADLGEIRRVLGEQ